MQEGEGFEQSVKEIVMLTVMAMILKTRMEVTIIALCGWLPEL